MVTRGKDGIRKPNPRYVLHTVKSSPREPKSIAEALQHPGWNESMVEEVDTCAETKTWSLVPRPADAHVLGCRWVHKIKLNEDGTVGRLRSRLVAKGNEQEEGIDFLETYSPVVITATVRLVLHTTTVNKWKIRAAELSWIADLLQELGYSPTKLAAVFCDNLSAVHLTANPVLHKKSKHFAIHYHFAREQVAKGALVVHHILAASQTADVFTKSLPKATFYFLRSKLGVEAYPTTSLRGDISVAQISPAQPQLQISQKPIKESQRSQHQDRASTVQNRVQVCVSSSTGKQPLQLCNRYALLSCC
ncbi:PREDICTED: uncharacterized protein LOC106302862 [Brassica oleracea var. oleracea]|uniref:uncharacterized protein LOC106302862 n=1 Tax=Brassica oleracea var. oleracea TaxID=109376 RepID=UPI0006A74C1A|nr:PREDICTED: uncharacterized protein LOC106302862 [Brassica oleracea var. oleracea]